MTAYFRLADNLDPEERLEEAALWKAMHDWFTACGDRIEPLAAKDEFPVDAVSYGRARLRDRPDDIPYWSDPAFLAWAGRSFGVGDWAYACGAVSRLHASGRGAFVKSTRGKHAIFKVPVGSALTDVADGMAYSFMDGGPQLMVQELVEVQYEHRFFVVGRKIVTHTPQAVHLTPLDHPQLRDFDTPRSREPSLFYAGGFLSAVAEEIARDMATPDAVIDCAFINGKPGCVEINPLVVGGVGLFACDVRRLAMALHARDQPKLKRA